MKTCFDSKVEVTDRFLSRLTATDSLSLDLDLLVHTKLLLVLLWRQDSLMSKAKWTIRNQRLNGSHMRIWQQRDAARWGFCSEHLEAACRGSSQLEIRRGASYDEWFSHFYQTIDSVQGLIEGDDGTEVNPLRSGKPRRLQRQLMCVLFIRQCRSAGASSSCGPKVHPHKKNLSNWDKNLKWLWMKRWETSCRPSAGFVSNPGAEPKKKKNNLKSKQSGCVLVGWDPLCAHFHPANVLPGRKENYSTINMCCGRAACLLVTQRSLCVAALTQPSKWKEKWIDLHRRLSDLIFSCVWVVWEGLVFTFQLFTFLPCWHCHYVAAAALLQHRYNCFKCFFWVLFLSCFFEANAKL